jgi:hypothetical protein
MQPDLIRWLLEGMIAPEDRFDSNAALGSGQALNAQHLDTIGICIYPRWLTAIHDQHSILHSEYHDNDSRYSYDS